MMNSTMQRLHVASAPTAKRFGVQQRINAPMRARQGLIVKCSAQSPTSALPQNLESLVQSFQSVPDAMQRYKQLLFFATKLETLPKEDHVQENKVKGCVSQVWVVPRLKEDGKIYWQADSDSQLTKGLAALLVQGLSGCTPEEIVRIQPDFIERLGLQQSLTPSRNNGFLNMFKLMQAKALDVYMQQQQNGGSASSTTTPAAASAESSQTNGAGHDETATAKQSNTPVADSMRSKLQAELKPLKLEINDDSNKHAGHGGYKGSATYSGETHFTVEIVSASFEGLTSIKRHRLVYSILDAEMGSPIHALSLVTKTPAEAGVAV